MKTPVLAALGLLAGSAIAKADDILLYKGKDLMDVTVLSETLEEVKFRMKGIAQEQSRPGSQVKEVVYSQFSDRHVQGLEAMDARDYDKANQFFLAAAGSAPKKLEWEIQYSLFKAAEALRLAKKYDAAIKGYDDLLTKVPKTRFFGSAYEQKALCFEAKNDIAKATETFQALKKEAARAGPRFDVLADFHLIRLTQKTDPNGALERFKELRGRAEKEGFSDIANLARLGVGGTLIVQGRIEEARTFYQEIIKERQASTVLVAAGAYLGLGNTYVSKKSATAEDYEAAMLPFLRVIFLYGPQIGTSPMVAESLYWAGRCFEEREKKDEKAKLRKVFFYQWCVREYAGSTWAQQAQARL